MIKFEVGDTLIGLANYVKLKVVSIDKGQAKLIDQSNNKVYHAPVTRLEHSLFKVIKP